MRLIFELFLILSHASFYIDYTLSWRVIFPFSFFFFCNLCEKCWRKFIITVFDPLIRMLETVSWCLMHTNIKIMYKCTHAKNIHVTFLFG